MGAGPRHAPVVEHVDGPRVHDVGQAMGNHHDGLVARELADGGHDVFLGLGVDIARCLVEDVDGAVRAEGAGQGEALALPAGEVLAVLLEARVEAVLAAEEVGDARELERGHELLVGGVRGGHEQVVPHGSGKEPGAESDHGHVAGKRRAVDLAHLLAAEEHVAPVAVVAAREQRRDGRLAAARLAHDGREAHRGDVEGDVREDRVPFLVREGHVAHGEVVAALGGARARLGLGQREQAEYLVARGDAVHSHVEEAAELAHRQEEVRRDEHDEERAEEVDGPRRCEGERDRDARDGAPQRHDVHHDD